MADNGKKEEKMFDKLIERHKNPVNIGLHLIAAVIGIYGLWYHSRRAIAAAIVVAIIGHLFPYKKCE